MKPIHVRLPALERGLTLNGLAIVLAGAVVLARIYAPATVSSDAASLAVAFVTACFAIINRGGQSRPADPSQPPATPPAG